MILSRLKNSQRNRITLFFLLYSSICFISRNKFESNQLDLTTFLELEEGWERNAVYLSPWKLQSFTPSEQPFFFFFFVHLGGNSRCLRRFLVRRLEGNRRTIFSSSSSGGWSWSNSEEDDSKERVSLWRRSEKEGRSWFYPRFELSLKKRRGKEDGLARFSRIYGSSGLHNIDPSTSSPQKGQACRRRIVLGNSSSSRPRMRRFSIISLLDRARHPFNFTFGRGTIVSRARSFNHLAFEQKQRERETFKNSKSWKKNVNFHQKSWKN